MRADERTTERALSAGGRSLEGPFRVAYSDSTARRLVRPDRTGRAPPPWAMMPPSACQPGRPINPALPGTAAISASYTPRGAILVPRASVLNGVVRSLLTSPERGSFKPARRRTSSNTLISQAFNNRTKMGVVRLCQRKGGERARKRSEIGLPAGPRGSDEWPQMPAVCGVPARPKSAKKNVSTGETGGGRGTVVKPSPGLFQ
jgi:hypothetical protein